MDVEYLNNMKNLIENLEQKHQKDILYIFQKYPDIKLNENVNGTFINMNELNKEIIEELNNYLLYIEIQKTELSKDEEQKTLLENKYFKS